MTKLKLITEVIEDISICEDDSSKSLYLTGVYSTAELENRNGRKYKKSTLEREIKKLSNKIGKNLYGELNHPTYPDINLERAAILVDSLEWSKTNPNDLLGRSVVLETPMGNIVKAIAKKGILGISSRGLGSVNSDGYVDDNSFRLLTWDIVASPSNIPSWVNGIYEAKEWTVSDNGSIVEELSELNDTQLEEAKNEANHELKLKLTPELIHYLAEDNNITVEDAKKIYGNVVTSFIQNIVNKI